MPCGALRAARDRPGDTTVLATAVGAPVDGLAVRTRPGTDGGATAVQVISSGRVVPVEVPDTDCGLTIVADADGLAVTVGKRAPVTVPGDPVPEVFAATTDLAGPDANGLALTARTPAWFDNAPTRRSRTSPPRRPPSPWPRCCSSSSPGSSSRRRPPRGRSASSPRRGGSRSSGPGGGGSDPATARRSASRPWVLGPARGRRRRRARPDLVVDRRAPHRRRRVRRRHRPPDRRRRPGQLLPLVQRLRGPVRHEPAAPRLDRRPRGRPARAARP